MDISALFQSFENSLSTYSGDDPLDPWDRFVEYLGKRVTSDDTAGMSFVLDRLVERFLHDERYFNDVRFVNHCIKCASYYAEPISLYAYIYSKGVGTRAAPLYVAWAQQFERSGAREQAEAVYQRAVDNQAQPSDAVLQEYRQFQMRTSKAQTALPATGRLPLPLTSSEHREGPADCAALLPADKTIRIISRSENLGVTSSTTAGGGPQTISMYHKEPLQCEGSELSFEEVRATRYFVKIRQEEERREFEEQQRLLREKEVEIITLKHRLEALNQELGGPPETPPQVKHKPPAPLAAMPPASWRVFGDQGAAASTSIQPQHLAHPAAPRVGPEVSQRPPARGAEGGLRALEPLPGLWPALKPSLAGSRGGPGEAAPPAPSARPGFPCVPPGHRQPDHPLARAQERELPIDEAEPRLDLSQGASFSHVTPNTSLGLLHATPSRVLPSPTVNTREALDVIMDMFQAPTLLSDPFNDMSLGNAAGATADRSSEAVYMRNGASSLANPTPASATPFTVFQDQENPRAAAAVCGVEKPKAARMLVEVPASSSDRPSESTPELTPDESTMWGVRYNSLNSLAACPNSSRDFAPSAQLVSTPFTSKAAYFADSYQDQENDCRALDDEENVYMRQPKKLSPIIEHSPADETFSNKAGGPVRACGPAERGTIVGEGLSLGPHSGLAASCTTVVHPPPGALSFRDHTLVQSAAAAWSVFSSPARPPPPSQEPEARLPEPTSQTAAATARMESHRPAIFDVPMSPECGLKPDWPVLRSPEVIAEPDLDAFISPPRPQGAALAKNTDVSMTPDAPPRLFSDVCVSPAVRRHARSDEEPMSPDRGVYACADVPMSPAVPRPAAAGGHLVSDPWDGELIAALLSRLSPPLGSHPHCITWQCNVPNITAKTTVTMGSASLRVDCLLGEGAFAKVYQATDPMTSEKMVVKVQKPAYPWEFYVNTQLDARLPPAVRHLYSNVQSAHLFHNGSILLAELHRCGTLLNAVNQYKKLSDKVMPQPLVMYFTVCMLHMVEQLHAIRLVHADIKPDNFLLGERFLESQCLDPDAMEHGMVLVDLGQSIDMELFPEGTAFTARCLTSGFQCTEMLSGRPWSYQTDYFGIAGSVYCMLFGTYMRVKQEDGVWKTNAVFRRNPHSELWLELFHALLNIPDGGPLPCLRTLRCRLSAVLRETYGSKLLSLKNRLVVLLLENLRTARR